MLLNYLKISLRKSWKSKTHSLIKLISLTTGIVTLCYISFYVHEEVSYDKFHTQSANIYRLNTTINTPTGTLDLALTATPVAEYLAGVAPEIEEFVRINKEYGSHAIRFQNNLFSESENIYYADDNFFEVFDFELLKGDKLSALQGPDKIIISRKMAIKYFGSLEVVDKTLLYDGDEFKVTGVLEDIPVYSQLQFEFLISMDTFLKSRPNANENWTWLPMNSYILLTSPKAVTSLQEKVQSIPHYTAKNTPDEEYVLSIESFKGLHFSSPKLGELGLKGSLSNVYILLTIGIMILLLAVSNYINLSVAQTSIQGKEVSVKKTLGASGTQIFKQFFVDSILYSVLAILLSVIVLILTLSGVERFIGHSFDLSILFSYKAAILALAFPIILAALNGLYPALQFSNISPILTQKTQKIPQRSKLDFRTALLMFQFTITSALIIGAFIIYNQLSFLQNKDLGITTDQILVIDFGPNSEIGNSFESLKAEFGTISGVNSVSFSSHIPGQIPNGVTTKIVDGTGQTRSGEINLTLIDYDFIPDYGLSLVAGRSFSADRRVADDTSALILNEAAVKAYGFTNPEDIIGASYEQWGGNGTVIGVVKDFNYLSLHNDVGLLSLKMWSDQFQKMSMKITPESLEGTLKSLQSKWESLYPNIPFNYYFVADNFGTQYAKDRQFADFILIFTLISATIGILGLIAFATFWCERRKKEISIRKVLGAAPIELIWKFYKEFSTPVLVSFIVATPIALYLGNQWLQKFAYQFNLSWTLLILPLSIVMLIIGLSVGFQSLKVVLTNPLINLKEE